MNKCFCIIIILGVCFSNSLSSQNRTPKEVIGTWESVQFRAAKEDSLDDRIVYAISPQMMYVDSLGNCEIQLFFESHSWKGKITNVKIVGRDIEVKYCFKSHCLTIRNAVNNPDYIFLTYPGIYNSILFKKYKRK